MDLNQRMCGKCSVQEMRGGHKSPQQQGFTFWGLNLRFILEVSQVIPSIPFGYPSFPFGCRWRKEGQTGGWKMSAKDSRPVRGRVLSYSRECPLYMRPKVSSEVPLALNWLCSK